MTASVNDIRRQFLSFFEGRGHKAIPSAPLLPQSDPTLLFVNAGMVPFKNIFTGKETPPAPRATSSQKCIRAGGKHNDLDNVGYTARHHTFFEMLGNFSFGDYFKEEAITNAWELCTKEFGIDASKLLVTVYHTDDEAFDLWKKIAGLPDEKIIRIPTSDNFWSMGDTGPCGPCSEIFYDHGEDIPGGPPGSPDEDGDRFIEIWNLVFMQFDQQADGEKLPLPKPSIDTGMGMERIAAVLQGVHSNYEIDLFRKLIGASVELTGKPEEGADAAAHRVIADHLRSSSFLIADGVTPSNEGRGYVLRRIMRRAMRYAATLGAKDSLMHQLVPTLVADMGEAYPELRRAEGLITDTLRLEEEKFAGLLDRGLKLLSEETGKLPEGGTLPGEAAFKLYDTYGFPVDLTEDALRRDGYALDTDGFDKAMAEQKERARAASNFSGQAGDDKVWYEIADQHGATEFLGYTHLSASGQVQAIVKGGERVSEASAGDEIMLVANQTPFYGESGGQSGDAGSAETEAGAKLTITDTKKKNGQHIHIAKLDAGTLKEGEEIALSVGGVRREEIKSNHSATHLVHQALRNVLGDHVTQKGSFVGPDRLRFDFSHNQGMTREEVDAVEAEVNEVIRQNAEGRIKLMPYDQAIEEGAMALFGEKYEDEVRVLSLGDKLDGEGAYSVELCGGTHVERSGDIALFVIVSEGAVASGIRRIEAVTGEGARAYLKEQAGAAMRAASLLKTSPEELATRIEALQEDKKKLEKELVAARKKAATGGGAPQAEEIGGVHFTGAVLEGIPAKELRGLIADALKKNDASVAAFIAVNDGKASASVGVSPTLTGDHPAPELVKLMVEALGGKGGGGKPDLAHGGGPDGDKAQDALAAIKVRLAG
ncbi:alanine--tRNA ligase [Parvularcula sp. ZS-1/3]|uniref:Alanine--tRNA ligase n=1 Tax=Parvularcula mediterranea TaxID=2732508 RepID=A0A7Y3RP69_9PROT|nr:alanine--tRNA ligase [Parvularcula mediterranea]NNU17688.1 alanine--tRNA ligase [Parvularcula mediterranea]